MNNSIPKSARDITPLVLLTTGQIARVMGVASRTAAKLIDSGAIRGHRLPGSLDRRVKARDFAEFLEANGYDVPTWLCSPPPAKVAFALPDAPPYFVSRTSPVELGMVLAERDVELFVAGDDQGTTAALDACACVKRQHPRCRVLVILPPDVPDQYLPGVDGILRRPVDWASALQPNGRASA